MDRRVAAAEIRACDESAGSMIHAEPPSTPRFSFHRSRADREAVRGAIDFRRSPTRVVHVNTHVSRSGAPRRGSSVLRR